MAATIRGPSLGTKLLILMSFALIIIPSFSYQYLREMEGFLVDSQGNAQLLTAEGISTLLNGRPDLFYELPLSPEGYEQLYAHPLESAIRIDGKAADWEPIVDYSVTFGETELGNSPHLFTLLLGEQNDQIYALVTVVDESVVYRDRDILRLDLSDHVRLTYTGIENTNEKMVITMTEPGVTTAYAIDQNWRYAIQEGTEKQVQGFVSQTDTGYVLEFRMPLSLLGSTRHFGFSVVDVDDPATRDIVSITGTLPSAGQDAFGLVLLTSPEVLKIVEGLGYSGATVQVIDSRQRVRAQVGSYQSSQIRNTPSDPGWTSASSSLINLLIEPFYRAIDNQLRDDPAVEADQVIRDSLTGSPSFQRRYTEAEGEVIIAAHPIISSDDIIGTVVLTQNTSRILELRRDALERIINFSVLSLFIFVALILAFSVRLARRIRKLGAEATNAIDIYGRLQTNQLRSETHSGDEIGDLARTISGMLARLHQHNQFLENMPRTLRHEINNPLNALSTSLQNLADENTEAGKKKYLASARRGVNRIGMIVQNLADAASLEEALVADDIETVDLFDLVKNYLANCRITHPDRQFLYRGIERAALCAASDYRVEQMLDKLIDNAVDFSPLGSTITVGIGIEDEELTLFVTNQGPLIAPELVDSIFDSMVSVRESNPDNRLHFGMGLYVVRVIAEHHQGRVGAANLINGKGVTIRVNLPLIHPQERAAA
jgi:dedicated sortase system histidine kinase